MRILFAIFMILLIAIFLIVFLTVVMLIVMAAMKVSGDLERNFIIGHGLTADAIVGEVAVVGVDGEEFCNLEMDFGAWKELLKGWGNTV